MRTMQNLLFAGLAFALAACAPSPKVAIVGQWDLTVDRGRGMGVGGLGGGEQLKLHADVRDDGRYTLSGQQFQQMLGVAETHGTYDFTDDLELMVTMDGEPMDFQATDYKIEVITKNELLLVTQDYTVTMRRAE